ncbi:MAG: nitrate transporter [Scytonematopsis contorta HA4267-MV1]|jgi:NitT/TauT family transport system permease protein|nr:nitrate transporter [Scytonematopsis contorta HA4267-MV1]
MERSIVFDILASLQRLFVGYIPAAALGVLIGLLIGVNGVIFQIFKWIFQIPRSITPIAFLPIALVVLKQNELAAIAVIFTSVLWSLIIDTATGVRQFYKLGNNFRVAVYHIFNALRMGIWVAWFTVIATEMLIGGRGLGAVVWSSYQSSRYNSIIEVLIYIGVIGFLLDQLLEVTGTFLS